MVHLQIKHKSFSIARYTSISRYSMKSSWLFSTQSLLFQLIWYCGWHLFLMCGTSCMFQMHSIQELPCLQFSMIIRLPWLSTLVPLFLLVAHLLCTRLTGLDSYHIWYGEVRLEWTKYYLTYISHVQGYLSHQQWLQQLSSVRPQYQW